MPETLVELEKTDLTDKWYRNPAEFSRKKTLSEIGVFLLITFGLMLTFGWKAYIMPGEDNGVVDPVNLNTGLKNFCYYIAAFSPALGCITARYIFREGFRDDILFPKFTGHFKGYLLAFILPLTWGIMNCILITVVLGAGFTVKAPGGILEVVAALFQQSAIGYMAFFLLIGEELGWRAFLYDKLECLFGLNASIVIGGIIWGVWHLPVLIQMGLNFGKDAPGFPITNVLLMCVFCVVIGAMLQMLRKMADSVVAPIIAHALIDTVCNVIATMFLSEKIVDSVQFKIGGCMMVSSVLIGIPCWVYMNKCRHMRNGARQTLKK